MDDNEYYAMMRRQYSHPVSLSKKKTAKKTEEAPAQKTEGTFSQWRKKYGHEDAEMFMERNSGEDME